MLITILICIAIILAGAVESKPVGWVVLTFGVLALLLEIGGAHIHLG
jgi:hypothetical protein